MFVSCITCNQDVEIRLTCLKINQSFSLLHLYFYPNLPLNFISDIHMQLQSSHVYPHTLVPKIFGRISEMCGYIVSISFPYRMYEKRMNKI